MLQVSRGVWQIEDEKFVTNRCHLILGKRQGTKMQVEKKK